MTSSARVPLSESTMKTIPEDGLLLYRVEVPITVLVLADGRMMAVEYAALFCDAPLYDGFPLSRITRIRRPDQLRPEEQGTQPFNTPDRRPVEPLLADYPSLAAGDPLPGESEGEDPAFDAHWAEMFDPLEDGEDTPTQALHERLYRVRIPFRALVLARDPGDALCIASTDAAYEVVFRMEERVLVERIVRPEQLRELERARTVFRSGEPGMPAWTIAEIEAGAAAGEL